MPQISIIVPIYRVREEYFRKCLDSLVNQTFRDIEIILIEDGAPEEVNRVCGEYAQIDERIRIHQQENKGVSAARNEGIRLAKGNWITFVDADDWLELDTCEKTITRAQRTRADIVIFAHFIHEGRTYYGNYYFLEDIDCMDESDRTELLQKVLMNRYKSHSCNSFYMHAGYTHGKLIRAELLKNSGVQYMSVLKRGEDVAFYFELYCKADRISYMNSCLYHYRINEGSEVRGYRRDMDEQLINLLTRLWQLIEENHLTNQMQEIFYVKCISDFSIILSSQLFHRDNKQSWWKKRRVFRRTLMQYPFTEALKLVSENDFGPIKRRNLGYYRRKQFLLLTLDWKLFKWINGGA